VLQDSWHIVYTLEEVKCKILKSVMFINELLIYFVIARSVSDEAISVHKMLSIMEIATPPSVARNDKKLILIKEFVSERFL